MAKQTTSSALTYRMSIKQAKEFISKVVIRNAELGAIDAPYSRYIALMMTSSPGIGKTSITNQVYKQLGFNLVGKNLATSEPTDLCGLPFESRGADGVAETDFMRPEFFNQPVNTGYFLDEMSKAPHMMAGITPLIHERQLGKFKLPAGSTIIAAGNNLEDRAGDSQLPSHTNDRLLKIVVYSTAEHWLEYASEIGIDPRLTGYIRWRGESSFGFDPNSTKNPTQRSWSSCANVLEIPGLTNMELITAMAGFVGDAKAGDFHAYLKFADQLDSPQEIIANPKTARIPEGEDAVGKTYAVTSSLIGHATPKTIGPIMEYFKRLPSKEFVVFAVKDIMTRYPKLNSDPSLKAWKLENHNLFAPVV